MQDIGRLSGGPVSKLIFDSAALRCESTDRKTQAAR